MIQILPIKKPFRELTPDELQRATILTNLVHSLAIVQEGYIKEAEDIMKRAGMYRYEFKRHIGDIRRNAELLRSAIHKHDSANAEDFGEDADTIEEAIKQLLDSKNIEI
jgi:hypothetical protein